MSIPAPADQPAEPQSTGHSGRMLMATSRAEAFSDGVFAVAITLLIFEVAVPEVRSGALGQALSREWPSYAAFITSFLTIGIIWVNHHATFSRIAWVDRPLLFINLLLLMSVSFIPFPTALVARYLNSGADARTAAVVYAATMTAMSIAFSGVWMYAVGRGLLNPEYQHERIRSTIPRFSIGMAIYAFTIVVALISPKADLALFAALAVFYVFDQQAVPNAAEQKDDR